MNENAQDGTTGTEKLRKDYSHRTPSAEAQKTLRKIRQSLFTAAVELERMLPPGREKSLALTKLDECRMWACSAATLDGEIREELVVPPADSQD